MVHSGGVSQNAEVGGENFVSPKLLGVKQGAIMFLSGIVVVPLLGILTEMLGGNGVIIGLAALILFMGGIFRMLYALLFQPGKKVVLEEAGFVASLKQTFLGPKAVNKSLPPAVEMPIHDQFSNQMGNWRDTADLEHVQKDQKATKAL
jgi:hypothetical protein